MNPFDELCPEPDCNLTVRQHLAALREKLARPAVFPREGGNAEPTDRERRIREQAARLLREARQ